MPDIMVYKHRKAQLALFRPVSRERIGGARTRLLTTKPTHPICRSPRARFVTTSQETVLVRHSILRTFQKI